MSPVARPVPWKMGSRSTRQEGRSGSAQVGLTAGQDARRQHTCFQGLGQALDSRTKASRAPSPAVPGTRLPRTPTSTALLDKDMQSAQGSWQAAALRCGSPLNQRQVPATLTASSTPAPVECSPVATANATVNRSQLEQNPSPSAPLSFKEEQVGRK